MKMTERPTRWAKNIFEVIVTAIEKEDKVLKADLQRYPDDANIQGLHGKGIATLYEKALRSIVLRAFTKKPEFLVYTEVPYKGKDKSRKCDLCVCDSKAGKRTWIEMKAMGYCTDDQYRTWLRADVANLQTLSRETSGKYLLVTSVDIDEPKEGEWKEWFQENISEVVFSGQLFQSFRIFFSDGKPFQQGYYTICLLRVP
jgi:hypothetical protein